MGEAARRWREALEGWAIPPHILERAPESPWGFPVEVFARAADDALATPTPSHRTSRRLLGDGGTVLDVGAGAGAASLPLVPPATELVAVDPSAEMLEEFARRAAWLGVAYRTVEGSWPEVADRVGVADVVVCHHVAYNVADIGPFLVALTTHARRGVVLEVTEDHPLAWTTPLWRELHGLDRPDGPHAEDLIAVIRELGYEPEVERWTGPFRLATEDPDQQVAWLRGRLCVADADRVREALRRHPMPTERQLVTLWWQP